MSGTHPTDADETPAGSPHVTAPERPHSKPPAAARVLDAGAFVAGYRLITPIGAGGMGRVFLADDERLARKVALKLLPPEDGDEEGRARFLREARALARVDHPNVVNVFASGVDVDIAWMALEYIEGDPLCDVLAGGPLDEETALSLAAQIARGLAAVHREGVVHRDIKPDNLLLDDQGLLRVVDFGVALMSEPGGKGGFTTRSGVAVGTPHYMAPEQARGGKVDERADVWALGATLWAFLTGKPPFWFDDEETDLDILSRVLREPIVDVRERVLVSQGTAELVHALLARDPDARPQDLDAVAQLLEALAEEAMDRADRGEALDDSFDPIAPEVVAAPDEEPLDDDEHEISPAARERVTRDDLPTHQQPNLLARGVLLSTLALLVAGAIATVAWLVSAEAAPPSSSPPPPPTKPVVTDPGPPADPSDLVLPGRPQATVDAGASPATEVPGTNGELDAGAATLQPTISAGELAQRVRAAGPDADEAARELVARSDEPAIAALRALVVDGSAAGGRVLALVLASTAARHLPVLEAALFRAPLARQRAVVIALEARKNIEALNLLRLAAETHPDASVRESARRASRSIFSVEGEDE